MMEVFFIILKHKNATEHFVLNEINFIIEFISNKKQKISLVFNFMLKRNKIDGKKIKILLVFFYSFYSFINYLHNLFF